MENFIWKKYKMKRPILEVGTGNGEISKLVFNKLSSIELGVDIDPVAVTRAKNCGLYRDVICTSCANLSIKDNSFNTVISNSTFEHIIDLKKSLNEVYRILKKNGVFIFSVPLKDFRDYLIMKFGLKNTNLIDRRLNHYNYKTLDEWIELLKDVGFYKIETRRYFSCKILGLWYILLKLSTLKIRNNELWSLVKQYFDFFPMRNIFSFSTKIIINSFFKKISKKDNKLMCFFCAYK